MLHDPNDVQDAFQATFLVLVRRWGAVRDLESLGGWLYGVANRVAARARVEVARRRAVEGRAALRVVEAFEPDVSAEMDSQEFGPIVQEEVRRLPEKYRAVVVLCYWEGLAQEQAAIHLGIPLGTVRSRIARARDLLRRRLTRRGLAPMAGVMAALDGTSASVLRLTAVPAELVQMTIRAAARVAAGPLTNPVVSGVVASLVQHVIWSMTMIRISGIVAGVVLMGLAGYGVRVVGQQAGPDRTSQPTPAPGKNQKSARRDAERKARPFEGIYSQIKGQTTIITILPDGAVVKKGDVVCELDSAALRDQLVNQQITTRSAKANFQNAKLEREEAEIAAHWFRNELYPRELREVVGEVKLAESELALAEEELKVVKSNGGNNTQLVSKRAEVAIARSNLALEKAKNRYHILTHYTKDHRNKELVTEMEKTRSNELAKQAAWELEKSKEAKLERQLAACTITAPIDGTVVYADFVRQDAAAGSQPRLFHIEVGATVRERQLILRIVPPPTVAPDQR